MTKHADRDHSEPYWPPTATREPRVRFPLDDGDTGASLLPVTPKPAEHGAFCPAFTAPASGRFRAIEATGPCTCQPAEAAP